MENNKHAIGFTYFSQEKRLVQKQLDGWLPALREVGAETIVYQADFSRAIPEDVFATTISHGLTPIIHFNTELPLARTLNQITLLLDVYAKWGVKSVILGDKPNIKTAWKSAGWHYENLVDHFLDRFIPLAAYAVHIGLTPVLAPMEPGGDYWDTIFIESVLSGLMRRRLEEVVDHLQLASYGYTYSKSLKWGSGGPECWATSKPYQTPEGQEDQLGFNNFVWAQASARRATDREFPVLILDAGNQGTVYGQNVPDEIIPDLQRIASVCLDNSTSDDDIPDMMDSVLACIFSLDTINRVFDESLTPESLVYLFDSQRKNQAKNAKSTDIAKHITHYLLLPCHGSGVSDVILNKIRPLIKHFKPTVGFSLEEAALARKVSVYPDPIIFTDEKLNQLRSVGCRVEVLPESGIEIATLLKD